MVSIYKKFNEQKLYSKMILQIHDELVFEIPQKELSEVKSIILQDMESVIPLKAPLKVDIGVGENWLEAH
jgi:DNA polymerase-1